MTDEEQANVATSTGLDRPLDPSDALEKDSLHRGGFAHQVVHALAALTNQSSIVVSVEGAWGSGKTSVLSMVEALLRKKGNAPVPVIVHFNPWLIGDRDALLHQFLSSVSKELRLGEPSKTAKKVAEEIDGYSKIVGLAKWIPGAEPVTSIVKAVLEAVGHAAKHASDPKVHGIEERKHRVEAALRKFGSRVIVLIDDVDRLYPQEVFEIIRIIKAVADLPNVGYVVTMDPAYVSSALGTLGVPKAHAYLDKIIQTRLPVPMLSAHSKAALITRGLQELPPEATQLYFPGGEDLLAQAYHLGLRDMLEQPRDFVRLFNVTRPFEAELRGEVAFADILALAALSIKAPPVYELIRRFPNMFVGHLPGDQDPAENSEAIVHRQRDRRQNAYDQCESPDAVRRLVHFLFPQVAKDEGGLVINTASLKNGRLAHPSRIVVALQLALTGADVSFRSIREFVDKPEARPGIEFGLTVDNCLEFLGSLGDYVAGRSDLRGPELDSVAVALARLADSTRFADRRKRRQMIDVNPWAAAIQALVSITQRRDKPVAGHLASLIACDPKSLSAAANLVLAEDDETDGDRFHIPKKDLEKCRTAFADNVAKASVAGGALFSMTGPDYILYCLARVAPEKCPAVFDATRKNNRSLDAFAVALLHHSVDSAKGETFALPSRIEVLTAYVPLEELTSLAKKRLAERDLKFPVRAAWQCVVEKRPLYGADGSAASR